MFNFKDFLTEGVLPKAPITLAISSRLGSVVLAAAVGDLDGAHDGGPAGRGRPVETLAMP